MQINYIGVCVKNAHRCTWSFPPPMKSWSDLYRAFRQMDLYKMNITVIRRFKYQSNHRYMHVFQNLQFTIGAVTVDPQTPSYDPSPLKHYLASLGVPYFYESQGKIDWWYWVCSAVVQWWCHMTNWHRDIHFITISCILSDEYFNPRFHLYATIQCWYNYNKVTEVLCSAHCVLQFNLHAGDIHVDYVCEVWKNTFLTK